jgi:hypothetical protein
MVLLDACRNDPGGRADAPNNMTQAYVNGFNFDVRNREVQAFATIYATAIGQRAYEYTEKKQGYFTWAIVEALKGGGANTNGEVTLSELVKYVQDTVPKRIAIDLGSGKQQRPFATIEGYKAEELVLSAPGARSSTETASAPSGSFVDPAAIELSFWDSIKTSTNPEDFKAYLAKYPDGQFAELAKLRAQPAMPTNSGAADPNSADMAYWNAIKDIKNPSGFINYMTKFPNGMFVDLAKSRIAELDAEREKAKEAADALLVRGTVWAGKTDQDEVAKFEFGQSGMFSGMLKIKCPSWNCYDYKQEISGTWSQDGNVVSIQLSKGSFQVTISGNSMEGTVDGVLPHSPPPIRLSLQKTVSDVNPKSPAK